MQNKAQTKPTDPEKMVRCYSHYQDNKNRLWLVVSVPPIDTGNIFLLEVKKYAEDELNNVVSMPFIDFLIITEQKKMVPYMPVAPRLIHNQKP